MRAAADGPRLSGMTPLRLPLFAIALSALAAGDAAADDYDWTSNDYQLSFELDSRTGSYRPAYSYKTGKGDSTIWLDGANARGKRRDAPLLVKFAFPAGWDEDRDAVRARAEHDDGTVFQIFASRTGAARTRDFVAEWNARAAGRYGRIAAGDVKTASDAGVSVMFVVRPDAGGVGALAVIYRGKRALPVMLEFPDAEAWEDHQAEMQRFLASIDLLTGSRR
jgi:hypothetical protein